MKNSYSVIGLMSGTSLDGVDLAWAVFEPNAEGWKFEIQKAETIAYTEQWLSRLVHLPNQTPEVFAMANVFYGRYLGQLIRQFMEANQIQAGLIASHGQTVFHNPHKGYTIQIGSGAEIAAATGVPTVCDLRTTDVALGGQGAPIVPLGERDLFPNHTCFINIGGITNISFHQSEKIIGYDICMGNIMLDYFAEQMGLPYDDEGRLARGGTVIPEILELLNQQEYLQVKPPKSLDANEVAVQTMALLGENEYSIPDLLATLVAHISDQISLAINSSDDKKVMLTGGGALNTFLMEELHRKSKADIILPNREIIEYKEALIMAYLGLQRYLKQVNVLSSVTGAQRDSINGALYL